MAEFLKNNYDDSKPKIKGKYILIFIVICFIGIGVLEGTTNNSKKNNYPSTSSWDGRALVLNSWFQSNLKDPDSLKIIEVSPVYENKDGTYGQRVKFRAKNSFGAYNISEYYFTFSKDKVLNALGN